MVAWILICLGPIRLSDLDPSQLQGTVFGDALSLWTGIGLSGQAAVIALSWDSRDSPLLADGQKAEGDRIEGM